MITVQIVRITVQIVHDNCTNSKDNCTNFAKNLEIHNNYNKQFSFETQPTSPYSKNELGDV